MLVFSLCRVRIIELFLKSLSCCVFEVDYVFAFVCQWNYWKLWGIFGTFVDEHGFGQETVLYIFGVISLWIFETKMQLKCTVAKPQPFVLLLSNSIAVNHLADEILRGYCRGLNCLSDRLLVMWMIWTWFYTVVMCLCAWWCRDDYYELFAPKCGGCGHPISEQFITALNQQWHTQCFVCAVSNSLLIHSIILTHSRTHAMLTAIYHVYLDWRGSATGRALDLRSVGRGFKSHSR